MLNSVTARIQQELARRYENPFGRNEHGFPVFNEAAVARNLKRMERDLTVINACYALLFGIGCGVAYGLTRR